MAACRKARSPQRQPLPLRAAAACRTGGAGDAGAGDDLQGWHHFSVYRQGYMQRSRRRAESGEEPNRRLPRLLPLQPAPAPPRRQLATAAKAATATKSAPTATASNTDPTGATAKCKDGTYSKSQHHSGTCSSHGGVAEWLTANSASGLDPWAATAIAAQGA